MKCLICGTEMEGQHCKVICPVCGYREDCSDAGLIIYPDEEETNSDNAKIAKQDRDQADVLSDQPRKSTL